MASWTRGNYDTAVAHLKQLTARSMYAKPCASDAPLPASLHGCGAGRCVGDFAEGFAQDFADSIGLEGEGGRMVRSDLMRFYRRRARG